MIKATWYYSGTSSADALRRDVDQMKRCGLAKALFSFGKDEACLGSFWDMAQAAGIEIHAVLGPGELHRAATGESVPRAAILNEDAFDRRFLPAFGWKKLALECWSSVHDIKRIALHLDRFVRKHSFLRGIHIDGLRYPNTALQEKFPCQCAGCQDRRKPWLGRGILTDEDLGDPSLMHKEIQTKIEVITALARELASVTQQHGLAFSIAARSVYAGRDVEFNRPKTWGYGPAAFEGQDWVAWGQEGILDEIHFMNYSTEMDRFDRLARQHKALLEGSRVIIHEGLGVSSSAGQMSPTMFRDQIERTEALGIPGVTFFSWAAMTEEHMRVIEQV